MSASVTFLLLFVKDRTHQQKSNCRFLSEYCLQLITDTNIFTLAKLLLYFEKRWAVFTLLILFYIVIYLPKKI